MNFPFASGQNFFISGTKSLRFSPMPKKTCCSIFLPIGVAPKWRKIISYFQKAKIQFIKIPDSSLGVIFSIQNFFKQLKILRFVTCQEILILFFGAVSAGFMGSLTGLGGGVVIIPFYSLLALVFPCIMQSAHHWFLWSELLPVQLQLCKEGFTNVRIGMFLEIATTTGAIIGALISGLLNPNTIGIIFLVS